MSREKKHTVGARGYGRAARWADRGLRRVRAWRPAPLTPAALQATAERMARLPDSAPGEIEAPLEHLCSDLREHPPTDLGAEVIRSTLLQALVSRRRLQHAEAPTPGDTFPPPVVLVGWYRTGTSLLQRLLSSQPGLGFVPTHRLIDPVGGRGSRVRAEMGTRLARLLSPELEVLHPVRANGPEECWLLLAHHLLVDGMAFHWHLPRFGAWLREVDRAAAYRTWARAGTLLEAQLGHGLVLKDPAHLLALPAILAARPDARLVWTHRDPADCVASYGSLTAVQHRTAYGRYDPERAGRACLRELERSLSAGLRGRAVVPEGHLFDLSHAALLRDPAGAVRSICSAFDLPFDAAALEGALDAVGPRPVHRFTLEQWGLERDAIHAAVPAGYDERLWA